MSAKKTETSEVIETVAAEAAPEKKPAAKKTAAKKADCVISSRRGLYAKGRIETAGLRVAVSTGKPCPQELLDLVCKNQVQRDPVTVLKPEVITVNGLSFRMLPVEGGTFQMGATPEQSSFGKEDELPVHEFHYWDTDAGGDAMRFAKATGSRNWEFGFASDTLYAGFPHLYPAGNGGLIAKRFVDAAAKYQNSKAGETDLEE